MKEIHVTAFNKKISVYGSISYLKKKTENEIFKIISPENFLNILVNKDTIKNILSFQLTNIRGNLPTLKDNFEHYEKHKIWCVA